MSKEALLVGEGLRLEDQCYSKRVSGRQGNTRCRVRTPCSRFVLAQTKPWRSSLPEALKKDIFHLLCPYVGPQTRLVDEARHTQC